MVRLFIPYSPKLYPGIITPKIVDPDGNEMEMLVKVILPFYYDIYIYLYIYIIGLTD